MLTYLRATGKDVTLLAQMNKQLIEDEGHSNPMTEDQLTERMRVWLLGHYEAILFYRQDLLVAYALIRFDPTRIYLRQFFVGRAHRRQGIGREAISLLLDEILPQDQRIVVEALAANRPAVEFWQATGFERYSIAFERLPMEPMDTT